MKISVTKYIFPALAAIALLLFGCSKKHHAESSKTPATTAPKKTPKIKIATPKVITVNDSAAHKTSDGRYYYDLQGKRYWKNKIDGKYYLYNKSMYGDPAFKGDN